jgi:hypothetical protein
MLTGTVYSRYLIGQLGLSGGDHHFVMVWCFYNLYVYA